MNVEQRQAAADPQIKPPDFGGRESACRLLSPFIIFTEPIKLILIYLPVKEEG